MTIVINGTVRCGVRNTVGYIRTAGTQPSISQDVTPARATTRDNLRPALAIIWTSPSWHAASASGIATSSFSISSGATAKRGRTATAP